MKKYMCLICGFIYDEEKGWPDDGIAPGTAWDDVPLTWTCPVCGAAKDSAPHRYESVIAALRSEPAKP